MLTRTKLLLTALIAALTLSAATTAQARRFELSNQRFKAVWTTANPLEFVTSLATIRCSVTIEGSFHSRTLSKVSGQLVGYITNAALLRPCTGGEAWIQNGTEQLPNGERPNSLPWHILYVSFEGTLPRIRRIRLSLRGAGFLIRTAGQGCLVKTTEANPAFGEVEVNETTGVVTGLKPDGTVSIPPFIKLEGLFNCPAGRFESASPAPVTLQGSDTTRIIIRLVQ